MAPTRHPSDSSTLRRLRAALAAEQAPASRKAIKRAIYREAERLTRAA